MKFPLLLLFATLASAQTELSGRVIDADGAPVKNARVTVLRYDFRNGRKQPVSIGRNATADARGEFQIQNIEQGRYYLRAEDPASSTRNPNALLLPSVIDRNLPTTLLTDTGSGIQIEMQRGHTYSVRGTVTPANVQAQVNVGLRALECGTGQMGGAVFMSVCLIQLCAGILHHLRPILHVFFDERRVLLGCVGEWLGAQRDIALACVRVF